MNNIRRKIIKNIINDLNKTKELLTLGIINNHKFKNELINYYNEIEDVLYDEQFALDNMPESLQCSYRAYQMEEYINIMENIIEDIDDYINNDGDVKFKIDNKINIMNNIIENLREIII